MSHNELGKQKERERQAIETLIQALASIDDGIRLEARHSIVLFRQAAVPELMRALQVAKTRARWEAAKALGEIRDPVAIPALISALDDPENDVRWAAADALIALGDASLVALLLALEQHPESIHLQKCARHILSILQLGHNLKPVISPVIDALEGVEPVLAVPIAAHVALENLTQEQIVSNAT